MTEFRINIVIDPSAADRGVKVVERRLNQLSGSADNLRNTLARALTGIGLAFSGRELMRLADEFTNIQNKLATVTDGVGELANKTEELFAIANRTRSSYAATAELYSRVARSAKVLGRTEQEVTQFTETLSKSLIVSGASAQEARAGLIQLSQGIASGVLRGDELRSVLEQLPYTADIIAKQLGITRGQLREFGEQGLLSAEVILDAFKNAAAEVDAAFAKTTPTLEQSFTVLRNNLVQFVGETNRANGVTAKLSEFIIKLSKNIEPVARSVVALSVALGTRYFLAVIGAATRSVVGFTSSLLTGPVKLFSASIKLLRVSVNALPTAFATATLAVLRFSAALLLSPVKTVSSGIFFLLKPFRGLALAIALATSSLRDFARFLVLQSLSALRLSLVAATKASLSFGRSLILNPLKELPNFLAKATKAVFRFSVALLLNPLMALPVLLAAGVAALVAFGDQIKISEGGLATIQDLVAVAMPKVISFFQEMVGSIFETSGAFSESFLPSIEAVLMGIASFVDNVIGFFTGLGEYLGAFWDLWVTDTETAFALLWQGLLISLEAVADNIAAVFIAIVQVIKKAFLALIGVIKNAGLAAFELIKGNLDASKIYADMAVNEAKNIGKAFTGIVDDFNKAQKEMQDQKLFYDPKDFEDDEKTRQAAERLGRAFDEGFQRGVGNGLQNTVQGALGGVRGTLDSLLKEAEARAKLRKETQAQEEAEKKLAAEREKADRARSVFLGLNKLTEDQLNLLDQVTGGLKELRKQYTDLARIREASEKRQEAAGIALDSDMLKQLGMMGPQAEVMADLLRQKLEKIKATPMLDEGTYNRALDNLTVQALDSATTVEAGFQRAFANIRLEATDFASVAENSFMVLADVGTDALTQLVTEGTVNFKDLARNAIAQLAQIISRLLMMQLLSGALGFLGFTPAAGAASAGISGAMASGGTTQPGRSYLVGERGPEVFTPGQTGVVSPNAASMPAAPPQVNVQVVNVNDPNEVPSALNSGRADQAILNVLQRNRQALQRITS